MRDDVPVRVRLEVEGCGLGEPYAAFARARLLRYGLDGAARAGEARAVIEARGPQALVDMLEIACLLGPAASRVDAIRRVPLGDRHEACSSHVSRTKQESAP